MAIFTAFCQEVGSHGTIWISTVKADNAELACDVAQRECAEEWDCFADDVHVLGLAEGDVNILYWQDQDE